MMLADCFEFHNDRYEFINSSLKFETKMMPLVSGLELLGMRPALGDG